jgi:hypothetical protein
MAFQSTPSFGGRYKTGNLHIVARTTGTATPRSKKGETLSLDAPRGRFCIKLGMLSLVESTCTSVGGEEVFARGC